MARERGAGKHAPRRLSVHSLQANEEVAEEQEQQQLSFPKGLAAADPAGILSACLSTSNPAATVDTPSRETAHRAPEQYTPPPPPPAPARRRRSLVVVVVASCRPRIRTSRTHVHTHCRVHHTALHIHTHAADEHARARSEKDRGKENERAAASSGRRGPHRRSNSRTTYTRFTCWRKILRCVLARFCCVARARTVPHCT